MGAKGDGLGAAELAAQHRSLDPAAWDEVPPTPHAIATRVHAVVTPTHPLAARPHAIAAPLFAIRLGHIPSISMRRRPQVVAGVGGLDEPLEAIRRRIWVPLCAPTTLLEELGAQRVKGLLLYGEPGCGKSLLGARLAAGLSRRPPTLVSGPEIMDKYVGNSEAQLRTLFPNPPLVPARPGDAQDVMIAAENSEVSAPASAPQRMDPSAAPVAPPHGPCSARGPLLSA